MKIFIIVICLNIVRYGVADEIPSLALSTEDNHGTTCTTKLSRCELKFNSMSGGPFEGVKGPKGDKGDAGRNCMDKPVVSRPGQKGDRGWSGNDGLPGRDGWPGMIGVPGIDGSPGKQGPIGPPGLPGLPGVCPCNNHEDEVDYGEEGMTEVCTWETPKTSVCKIDVSSVRPKCVIGANKLEAFEVNCNKTKLTTCILSKESIEPSQEELEKISWKLENETFWLDEKKWNFNDFYKLTSKQIVWLQKQSTSVTQKIRYYCKNSNPFPKDDVGNAIGLLTWNDVLIGPLPTSNTPFFYSVPKETDGCNNATGSDTVWRHTDIILITNIVNRLPITNFHIRSRDSGKDSRFYIRNIELCFG